MRKYLTRLLLAGTFLSAGCVDGNKKPGTVRPARPDEPRESKKVDVPAPVSRLMPDEINENNYQEQARVLQEEMDRELRSINRAERRSAAAAKE